jgi:hypothetical protein
MSEFAQPKRALKFFLIILAGTAFAILLHQAYPDPLKTLSTKPTSIVVTSGWFPPIASAALALSFGVIGVIFFAIQRMLPGTKIQKGGSFGLALSGMYLIGMIEGWVLFPVSLFGEIYTGIADGCGILLLSLLLGKFMAGDTPNEEKRGGTTFPASLIIAVIFVVARYFSYTVLHIESTYIERPMATFLWTAGMGGWVAIMVRLVGRYLRSSHPLKQAFLFGGLVFGLNWLVFNLFALLFIVIPLWDLLFRSVIDALGVTAGVYISSLLPKQRAPASA